MWKTAPVQIFNTKRELAMVKIHLGSKGKVIRTSCPVKHLRNSIKILQKQESFTPYLQGSKMSLDTLVQSTFCKNLGHEGGQGL